MSHHPRLLARARPAIAPAALAALSAVVLAPGPVLAAPAMLTWSRSLQIPGVLDVVGPRSDGELVVAADNALYRAKHAGRNQVQAEERRAEARAHRG